MDEERNMVLRFFNKIKIYGCIIDNIREKIWRNKRNILYLQSKDNMYGKDFCKIIDKPDNGIWLC